jgi:hypothetical protein
LAGTGSLGAVQVRMLKALTRAGMIPDFDVSPRRIQDSL